MQRIALGITAAALFAIPAWAAVQWSASETYVPSNPTPTQTVEKRITVTLDDGSDTTSCREVSSTFQGDATFPSSFAYTVSFAGWRQNLLSACLSAHPDGVLEDGPAADDGDSFTFTIATLTPPQGGAGQTAFTMPIDVYPPGKAKQELRGSFTVQAGDAPSDLAALAAVVNGTGGGYNTPQQPGTWRSLLNGDTLAEVCSSYVSTVTFTSEQTNCVAGLHGTTTAAFDRQRYIYTRGGGGFTYEGNEIYRFDLATGQWARMTDTGRAIKTDPGGSDRQEYEVYYDDGTPSSARHYAHLIWAKDRLLMGPSVVFGSPEPVLWDLITWSPNDGYQVIGNAQTDWSDQDAIGICSDYDPETGEAYVSSAGLRRVDPETGTSTYIGMFQNTNLGASDCMYDPGNKTFYDWKGQTLHTMNVETGETGKHGFFLPIQFGSSSGLAIRDGKSYVWNGGKSVYLWNHRAVPTSDFLHLYNDDSTESPEGCGIESCSPNDYDSGQYGKWWYVEALDVFVGMGEAREGLWVYRPPNPLPTTDQRKDDLIAQGYTCSDQVFGWECPDLQTQVNSGTVQKGIYKQGAVVANEVDLNDSWIQDTVIEGKAALIAEAGAIIRNVKVTGATIGVNANCVRLESTGAVEIHNMECIDADMGVLGNTMSVLIEDSIIGPTLNSGVEYGHATYFCGSANPGECDVTIRNTTIQGSGNQGHLLKTGAASTTLENVTLTENGNGSRVIDAFNGGVITISNSTITAYANDGNGDVMGYATEGRVIHPAYSINVDANTTIDCAGGRLVPSPPADYTMSAQLTNCPDAISTAPVLEANATSVALDANSAEITVTTDQSLGTLYWAAVPIDWNVIRSTSSYFNPPADMQNPTGVTSSGSVPVNAAGDVTFTVGGLLPTPQEEYWVYAQHVNDTGQSQVISSYGVYTKNGTVIPLLSAGHGTPRSATTADIRVLSTEDEGTLSWVVTTSATAPTVTQIEAGQDHNGVAATLSESKFVTQDNIQHWADQGPLNQGTTYYAHFVHRTGAGVSSVLSSDGFVPQDTSTPNALAQVVNGTGQGYTTAMQSGTWRTLGDRVSDICSPGPDTSIYKSERLRCIAGLNAWTGAAFDGERHIYWRGGGHSSYEGNEVYRFDLVTGDVVRLHNSGRAVPDPYNNGKLWFTDFYHDGSPPSAHHYSNLTWAGDRLVMGPLLTFRGEAGSSTKISEFNPDGPYHGYRDTLDAAEQGWNIDTIRVCSQRDPATDDVILLMTGNIYRYDPDTETATQLGGMSVDNGEANCFYDADTQTLYGWKNDILLTAVIGATSVSNQQSVSSFRPTTFGDAAGIAKRTVDGQFYVWGGAQSVFRWDQTQVPTADFTELANTGTTENPAAGCGLGTCEESDYSRGTFGKWWYVESLDVFIGLDDPGEPLWVWKP